MIRHVFPVPSQVSPSFTHIISNHAHSQSKQESSQSRIDIHIYFLRTSVSYVYYSIFNRTPCKNGSVLFVWKIAWCEAFLFIYITYDSISTLTPWAVAGPHRQLPSNLYLQGWYSWYHLYSCLVYKSTQNWWYHLLIFFDIMIFMWFQWVLNDRLDDREYII